MYQMTDEFFEIARKYRTGYYAEVFNFTPQYVSNLINKNKNFTCILAKAFISICFNIPFDDIRMKKLLEQYFIKTNDEI